MKVFNHHVYEYRKGLRDLILYTANANDYNIIKTRLERLKIDYLIYKLKNNNINVFFGDHDCIDVIREINKNSLTEYTPEEDFILGVMLGYCRKQQCKRYLKLKEKQSTNQLALTG
ncbi:MAG: DUF2023 family protein [bacterium]|nr:DUF2023 family protein [bacterium]